MKKSIFFIIAVFAIVQSARSQEEKPTKKAWVDLQAIQHIGLSDWNNMAYVNEGLPGTSVTELRGVLNILLGKSLGVFGDLGIGIMPAPDMKSFDVDRMPMPYSGTKYYLREMLSEPGSASAKAHFKFTMGFFADFQLTEKLSVMPYLGVGGLVMSRRTYEMILKEQGSNTQYHTTYIWGDHENSTNASGSASTLGYLSGRLNFGYKITPKSSLLFGLEYNYFFNSVDFYGRYSNVFNANIQRDFTVEGNKMNMLGISVGISFR